MTGGWLIALAVLAGCTNSAVVRQAASDWRCPEGDISAVEEPMGKTCWGGQTAAYCDDGPFVYTVQGCDRRGMYLCSKWGNCEAQPNSAYPADSDADSKVQPNPAPRRSPDTPPNPPPSPPEAGPTVPSGDSDYPDR